MVLSFGLENVNKVSTTLIFLSGIGAILPGLLDTRNKNKFKQFLHEAGACAFFVFLPLAIIFYSGIPVQLTISSVTGFITICFSLIFFYFHVIKQKKAYFQKINILILNIWLIITPLLSIWQSINN